MISTKKADSASAPQMTGDVSGTDRVLRNVIFSWGGYLINIVIGFVIPRLISDHLGKVQLGLWDLTWSVVSYFGLIQLGLGSSINRYVARYRAIGDTEGLNCSASTIAIFLRAAGWLAMAVAIVTAVWVLPLLRMQELMECRWIVLFLGAEVALSIMLTVYGAVIVGCHRWDMHNTISAITYGVIAVVMTAILLLGGSLPQLALAHCLLMTGGELARRHQVRTVCPELRISRSLFSWPVFKEQAGYSAKSLLPRVAELFSNQTVNLLLAYNLGPGMLAIFARPRALLRTLQTMAAKAGSILTPTASSLHAQEDHAALRSAVVTMPTGLAAVALPVILTMAICGDTIIRMWMGPSYVCTGLVGLLSIGALPSLLQEPVWGVLAGMNVHGRIALARLVAAIVAAVLLFAGLKWMDFGLRGAALCVTLPRMLVDGFITPACACRRLELSLPKYYYQVLSKPLLAVAPFAVGLYVLNAHFYLASLGRLSILVASMICSFLIYWRILPISVKLMLARRSTALFARLPIGKRTVD